ncbi:efflux RND transporter periplasmic adaptor subunit [Neptuniibacter sp. QD57_21]|uniref:efflux RND transporter periplasmic adaptor subunit n=1 Tax=Neptuniibacter sp. QD57_21 TaxID=3398213 RepID=UPI0039F62BDC
MRQLFTLTLLVLGTQLQAAESVVVKPLSELLAPSSQSAPAQVINDHHVIISSRLNAPVEEVLVNVGDQLDKGAPLLKLECRDFDLRLVQVKSELNALQAQTRLARQQLSRAERLLKQRNASKELRDQRRAELDSLIAQASGSQARLDEAELAVARCTPVAPFTGVVTERLVGEGSLVASGTPLFKILAEDRQEVSALLSSKQLASLPNSTKIEYQIQQQRFPLELRVIVPFVENRARTQEVRLQFSADKAISGSSGRLVWQEPQGRLPVQYIVSRDGQLGVMGLNDSKAEFIALPKAVEGQAAVVDLPLDMLVIVEGQHGVESGSDVTVMAQE